jgi:phosphate ABC transporter permease protein PstC
MANRVHTEGAAADLDRPLLLTPGEDLAGYVGGLAGRFGLFLVAASSILAVLLIFAFIIREAIPFFFQSEAEGSALRHALDQVVGLFGSTRWYPEADKAPEFGALAIVSGSLYVTVTALVVAAPLGLLTAVCLSDMVPFGVRQIIKPVVELLAAIPSVAYGFFAVLVLSPLILQYLDVPTGKNVLNAGFILAVMAIPTIVSVSEDALSAVGRDLREASYACGATRAETILRVVMPAAHNGIMAAVILGMMRAIGETMAVWMAAGMAAQVPSPWWDLAQSVRPLTGTIAQEMGETVVGSTHYHALFVLGLVLLIFTFGLNLVTEALLKRMRRQGGRSA